MVARKLISIGVDSGSSGGGIAIIDCGLEILELCHAPYYTTSSKTRQNKKILNKETMQYEKRFKQVKWTDETKLRDIYKPYLKKDIIYTIEEVFVRPEEGSQNSYNFGNSIGIHKGIYTLLNPIKYYKPTASEWKTSLGLSNNKELSVDLANKIFKLQLIGRAGSLLEFQKSNSNKHVDLAESLLLSYYGLSRWVEDLKNEE